MFTKGIMVALFCSVILLIVGVNASFSGSDDAPKKFGLEDFQKAGQFVCAWNPGSDDEALKTIKDLGLEVVLVSDGAPGFIICKSSGDLEQETLDNLRKSPSLR
jgi:hypothetical protein